MACGPNATANTNIGGQPSRSVMPPNSSVPIVDLKTGLVNPVWQQYFAGINLTQYFTAEGDTVSLGSGQTLSTDEGDISGTNTGDQNLFSTIAVSGQDSVVADSSTDTLTLAAGTNIGITTVAGTDTITIATSGLGTLATQDGTFSGTSSGTNTGDQNLFANLAVAGQDSIVADSTTDTLTLAAGTNISLTTNATTDTVTINNTAAVNSFETIAVTGQDSVVADSGTDTLTLAAGSGITLTTNAATDTVTVAASSSAVTAFSAYVSQGGDTLVHNVTGDGTVYTVIFNSEDYDTGSNYDNTTGIFTASITGYYLFNWGLRMWAVEAAHLVQIQIVNSVNGKTFVSEYDKPFNIVWTTGNRYSNSGSAILYMSAAAPAHTVSIQIIGSLGTKSIDLEGSGQHCYFSGYFIGA